MGTETVAGKILIGVAVAVISGAIGALGGAIFTGNVPPEAEITPEAVTVRPDASVQFSAEASRDPEGGNLTYTWSVGGIPFDKTPWAQCSADGPRAECRFLAPGSFGVAVQVMDEKGDAHTAISATTVEIEGGYIGLRVMGDDAQSKAIYRALLASVDWAEVQVHAPRLMIFTDPDHGGPVYAAALRPDSTADLKALSGVKVMVPFMGGRAFEIIEESLSAVGATVTSMRAEEVILALDRGLSNVGFISLSKPGEIDAPPATE